MDGNGSTEGGSVRVQKGVKCEKLRGEGEREAAHFCVIVN